MCLQYPILGFRPLVESGTMKPKSHKPVIAIVDDNVSICRGTKRLLCFLGFDAVTFASGQEFIDTLEGMRSFDPDCVILDVQMPGLNGFEVQERLGLSRRNIPVIFLTAFDEVWIREQALASGAAAFLSKPCSGSVLIDTLRAVLKIAKAEDS